MQHSNKDSIFAVAKIQVKQMKLSELESSQSAYITKVNGGGAFMKRINEMGIISGALIKSIKKAPLQDPAEYEVMGYRVTLRNNEAEKIEVEFDRAINNQDDNFRGMVSVEDECNDEDITNSTKNIKVALVGNPNCGKTTLFNYSTGSRERVGNFSGVTVDMKSANLNFKGYHIELIDLPGTYSLSEYTPEELYVRECLTTQIPDVVINVVDASNLERNLLLTTQLIDINIKMVIALNMYDEMIANGDKFDYEALGVMIGSPIVPTTASKGIGIEALFDKVIELYEGRENNYRHLHINYGDEINSALARIKTKIKQVPELYIKYHTQYLAIKLLEKDKHTFSLVNQYDKSGKIINTVKQEIEKIESYNGQSSDSAITAARYSFIEGSLLETLVSKSRKSNKGYAADKILTNKWLAIPIFIIILGLIFQVTFSLGNYPMEWIESGIDWLGGFVSSVMSDGILRDMIVDGIIGGVGGVLVFLPNIMLLFLFISLLEDSGYMARAAFITDKLMHKIGLHGKSFIPMLMGFGCNVPAVLATRTLESRKDRLITMLIIPFMSCSARIPIYILLISAFFTAYQGLVLLSIYLIGILIAIISALLFNKILFKGKDAPFVMELPPYRRPTLRNTARHTWAKSKEYLHKMGGVILVASIIVWALGYFPRGENGEKADIEHSYIATVGHTIEPVIEPLGFDWRIGVSLISGIGAKELVVSTMSVLYHSEQTGDNDDISALSAKIRELEVTSPGGEVRKAYTPLTAYSLMLFILIYFPCIAVVAAIKKEAGWRWAFFSVFYTTTLAWVVAFAVQIIGSLFL